MKEAFDLIKERLEPESDFFGGEAMGTLQKMYYCKGVEKALSIVSEVEAEYGNGWIPCSERVPTQEECERGHTFLVTVNVRGKFTILDFCLWGTENEWLVSDGRKVLAWMPLPEPYKTEKGV